MKLTRVAFENAMELEGSIVFPEGKAVVIYGENKAGKSNIIHALRYAFLSKVISSRRAAGYDELRLVSFKEIAPTDGMGKITVEFEHNGEQFEIHREIDRYKDSNKIFRKENGGFQEVDFKKTVTKELKAGLLDALFAPDSAMGFKHLNEKNIDAVIRELFREIGNAKVLAKDFKQRVTRLDEEAQARVAGIKGEYDSLVADLKERLKKIPVDLSSFEQYEPGMTSEKIGCVAESLKGYIDSVGKPELKKWLKEMGDRAGVAEDIESLLKKDKELRAWFGKIEDILQDKKHLSQLLAGLGGIKLGGPVPEEPTGFCDEELNKRVMSFYRKIKEAQDCYSSAVSLAQEEGIDFSLNLARLRADKEKVLRLLSKEIAIPSAPRVKVDLVKISSEHGEESVHALVPLEKMEEDTAFTKLSSEPIPDAPEERKRQYAEALGKMIERLKTICKDRDDAENFFNNEFAGGIRDLSACSATLMEREKEEREKISRLVSDVYSKLLRFAQEDVSVPDMKCERDLEPFMLTVGEVLSRKKSDYRLNVLDRAKNLGVQVAEFSTQEMNELLRQIVRMEEDIPLYRGIWAELTGQRKNEWGSNDAAYADLAYVPAVVKGLDKALGAILDNAFDEQEVIQGIKDIIVEINEELRGQSLVNSCIEIGEDSLQLSKTTYKGREITHPCGAERSFFSLATLTALARYFQLPVIIDEAANNLDKNHLRHFISLVREFAASYDVQYILSIKETDDFPLGGWVQEFADDLQIYQVKLEGDKKQIKPVELYA